MVDSLNCFPFFKLSEVLPRTLGVHVPMFTCRNLSSMCLETEIELLDTSYVLQKLPNFSTELFYYLTFSGSVHKFPLLHILTIHTDTQLVQQKNSLPVFFAIFAKGWGSPFNETFMVLLSYGRGQQHVPLPWFITSLLGTGWRIILPMFETLKH